MNVLKNMLVSSTPEKQKKTTPDLVGLHFVVTFFILFCQHELGFQSQNGLPKSETHAIKPFDRALDFKGPECNK